MALFKKAGFTTLLPGLDGGVVKQPDQILVHAPHKGSANDYYVLVLRSLSDALPAGG